MNDAIKIMLDKYNAQNTQEYAQALREIIQEIALVGLWRSKFFEEAAFYGGTALRIFYGLDRFSEDLDFSLLKANPNFSLETYNQGVKAELVSFGFDVTVEKKVKVMDSNVESAFIKANTTQELLKIGIPSSSRLHPQSVMKIKFEVDTDPPLGFKIESKILNNPIPVGIKTYVPSDLFAGKMHAMLFRLWGDRVKGRDWYDFVWYIRNNIPLNLHHLELRMKQTGHWKESETLTKRLFEEMLYDKIEKLNIENAYKDIRPFVKDEAALSSWSPEFFKHFADKMTYSA